MQQVKKYSFEKLRKGQKHIDETGNYFLEKTQSCVPSLSIVSFHISVNESHSLLESLNII
jgi:hypothetical protein